jgi:REG-2-like HAD superfamily hydrolase
MEATLPWPDASAAPRADLQPSRGILSASLAAVFLDFGNTLVRERDGRAEVYAEEARAAGLALDAEEMAVCMERAHAELPREIDGAFRYSDPWFRAFQEHVFVRQLGLAAGALPALSVRLFERFEDPATFVVHAGAHELLAHLRARGLVVGLISNWSERLPRLLARLGLARAFDLVLGSASERLEKPDPALFARALARARVPAARSLHAGDHVERDARGALAAGMAAVLVDHAGRLAPSARALCPVVASLPELEERILERCA